MNTLTDLGERIIKAEEQRDQLKAERDTLIDDIDWQQKKIERLEEEKDDMLLEREYYNNRYKDTTRICKEIEDENEQLKHENKENNRWYQMHKECADAVYNKKMMYESLLTEISQHIGNKPSSSTYKYFRAKLDGVGVIEHE